MFGLLFRRVALLMGVLVVWFVGLGLVVVVVLGWVLGWVLVYFVLVGG